MLCNFLFLGLSASFRLGEVEHLVKQLEVVVVDDGEVLGIANQMEAPIDLKTGFNWHEKRLQRVKSKLFSLKPFNLS